MMGKFISPVRLDAWVLAVVRQLVKKEQCGGNRKKTYDEGF